MADLVIRIAAFIESLILIIGYPGITVAVFLEFFFPPVPVDLVMLPFAGMLAAQQHLTLVGVWLAAVIGFTLGGVTLYGIGKWADEAVLRRFIARFGRWFGLQASDIDRFKRLFNQHSTALVFFGRMLPAARPVIALVAGMSGMGLPRFTLLTLVSSMISTGGFVGIGYIAGENWRDVIGLIQQVEPLLLPLIVIGLVGAVLFYVWRRTSRQPDTLHPAAHPPDAEPDS